MDATNPYQVLGISKDSSQDDIKKKYRSLCLKYHPDKNVNTSDKEREQCEKKFKQIQEANSLIGLAEDRRRFDSQRHFGGAYGHGGSGMGSGAGSGARGSGMASQQDAEDIFRRYFQQSGGNPFERQFRRPSRRSFYVNGIDISRLFDQGRSNGMNPFAGGRTAAEFDDEKDAPRSIYMETITVPLDELYNGVRRKEFQLSDSFIQKYKAAFRGGLANKIAIQSLFTSLPLLIRASWPISLLSFIATFHLSLPHPSRLYFSSEVKAGWKGGTKLKFIEVDPGLDVIFVLREGKHDRFERDGNDLITSINIGRSKAKKGCTLFIESLGQNEMPITVKLKRGYITENGQVVTVEGKGWPKPGGGAGDLKITVNIISDARANRLKEKKAKRKNHV